MALSGITKEQAVRALVPHFRDDPKLHMLCVDCGFSATDPIKNEFPDRFHMMGIMEQAVVGAAAGMAIAGLRPIIYSIAQFITHRALEQLYLNLVKDHRPVKILGIGKDDYFDALGHSHTILQRDIRLCEAIGLSWIDPISVTLEQDMASFLSNPQPMYMRVL